MDEFSTREAETDTDTESGKVREMPKRGRPKKPSQAQSEVIEKDRQSGKFKRNYIPLSKPTRPNPKSYTECYNYWKDIYTAHPDRVMVYVYRKWPIIDKSLTADKPEAHKTSRKRGFGVAKYIAKYTDPVSEEQFIKEHGSGTYSIKITDCGQGELLMDYKEYVFRDLVDHPPQLDIRELVVSDPANRDYIAKLRREGVAIPGDPVAESAEKEKEKEEERKKAEMADQTAQSALVGGLVQLVDRVVERPASNPPADPGLAVEAVKGISSMMNEGLKAIVGSLKEERGNDRANPVADPSTAAMSMLRETIGLVKALTPPPPPAPDIAQTLAPIVQGVTQSLQQMQQANRQAMELITARIAEKPDKAEEPLELLRAAKALKEELREEEDEKPPALPPWVPIVLQLAQSLPLILQQFRPQDNPGPVQAPTASPNPNAGHMYPSLVRGQGQGQLGMQNPHPHPQHNQPQLQPQLQPQPVPQAPDPVEAYLSTLPPDTRQYLEDILVLVPLIPRYMDQGRGGDEFAELIAVNSMDTLEQMQNMGAETLHSVLCSLPGSTISTRYPKARSLRFVEEFCDYDPGLDDDDDETGLDNDDPDNDDPENDEGIDNPSTSGPDPTQAAVVPAIDSVPTPLPLKKGKKTIQ